MLKKYWEEKFCNILNIILLLCFVPVLSCVIFVGMDMDYNKGLKLQTLYPNFFLFLITLLFIFITLVLTLWCCKYKLDRKKNFMFNMILILLFTGVYFISVKIAKEIAFKLPWDIMVVRQYACEIARQNPLEYNYYLSVYSNNIPISYILGRLLRYADETGYPINQEFIWIQVNCILMSVGGFFSCLTVKRITRNMMPVLIAFILNFLLIGLSAWKIAPYTDTYGQLFPIACIYFYICYMQSDITWKKIIYLALAILFIGIGGFIKPNLFVILIALVIMEIMHLVIDIKKYWKFMFAIIIMLCAILWVNNESKEKIIGEIGLDFNANIEAGPAEYIYMGLNEESTGSYHSGDAAVYGEFQFTEKSERDRIVFRRALERIQDRGFIGTLYFWLRKMVMTFNDGLFGWKCEVWIDDYYNPEVAGNTDLTVFLRGIYWDGAYVGANNTIMQLVWIYCLLGIPGLCFNKKRRDIYAILVISFLGIFFYQMLFEARARYLFAFLPLIITCSTCGIYQYSRNSAKLLIKKNLLRFPL